MATHKMLTDVSEFCSLSAALTEAVNEARSLVARRGVCKEVRELTLVARAMLDDLTVKMTVHCPLEEAEMRAFCTWAEQTGERLDALATIPYTTLQ